MPTKAKPATAAKALDVADNVVHIYLSDLHPAADNPRRALGDVAGLAASIESNHILQPLLVTPRAEGGYTIVAGHRRHAAAQIAALSTAPCVVRTMTDAERVEAMAIENLQREDLSPLEEAQSFQLMVDAGRSQRDIAERCGVSQATVSKRLSLLVLPATIRDLVESGKTSLRDAEEIAKARPEVLALVGSPAFIANRHGRITSYEVDSADRQLKADEARAGAAKSGLPEWDTSKLGWNYEAVKKADATHFRIDPHNAKTIWVTKPAKTAATSGKTAGQKATERAQAERATARRAFAGRYLGKLEEFAIRAMLLCRYMDLRTDGDDARIALDWLGVRHGLAKDTKAAAVDAWIAYRTDTAIMRRPALLFTVAVVSKVEASFDNNYHAVVAQGLYLTTLAQLGWDLSPDEKKISSAWLDDLADDSGGIIQHVEFTNSTIDQPPTVWEEPELHQAADVPPAARCASCTRPATTHDGFDRPLCEKCAEALWERVATAEPILGGNVNEVGEQCASCTRPATGTDPATGEPICDACWEQTEADTATAGGPATVAAPAGPDFAEIDRRRQERLDALIATLPAEQQAWMADNTTSLEDIEIPFFHSTAVHLLVDHIRVLADVDHLRHIVAHEVHRSAVERRQSIITAALDRIADLVPDDVDIRHAAINRRNPMTDDAGEPVVLDRTQDDIAADEAAHRIPVGPPWPTYDSASEERLLKTISAAINVTNLTNALDYEAAKRNRARVIEALQLRIAAVTGSLVAS